LAKTSIFFNEFFLKHATGGGHPETPQRLDAIYSRLYNHQSWSSLVQYNSDYHEVLKDISDFNMNQADFGKSVFGDPPEIFLENCILKNHSSEQVELVKKRCESGPYLLDLDTPVSPDSFSAALLAVSYGIIACQKIVTSDIDNAVLLVRPPGHHATPRMSMGFCLFNNIAITARYLQLLSFKRIFIFDFDVHHGNGTQDSFYSANDVLFCSIHQYPHYPGSGSIDETGDGEGEGFTLNIPAPAGSDEKFYLESMENKLKPVIDDFQPEICLISAGFDAHKKDPLSDINLDSNSYACITEKILDYIKPYCPNKVISFLEGGYNLDALSESVVEHCLVLRG
jgi:acetoin utilization deacetylase AcuC-like enzyme